MRPANFHTRGRRLEIKLNLDFDQKFNGRPPGGAIKGAAIEPLIIKNILQKKKTPYNSTMKSFIATALAATALAIKVKDTTQTDADMTGPVDMPDLEDWEWEAMGLYYCIDSHGEEDGVVSLLELAAALHEGAEAGVIPETFLDSFGENVNMTGLLADHMEVEEAIACDADGDQELMAGEVGACTEAAIEGLVEAEDWEALEVLLGRLHAVEISLEDAGRGMEAALEGTGLPREQWASEIAPIAGACWEAHHDEPQHEGEEDWHMPAFDLGMCIDSHGDGDGKLQVREIVDAIGALHENGLLTDETVATLEAEKPEDLEDDDTVKPEHVGELIETILTLEGVDREDWAEELQGVAELCWAAHDEPAGSTTEPAPSTTDMPATALAQLKAKYGR